MIFDEKPKSDPYFTDIPWEQFRDEDGRLIGEVYIPLPIVEGRKHVPNSRTGRLAHSERNHRCS